MTHREILFNPNLRLMIHGEPDIDFIIEHEMRRSGNFDHLEDPTSRVLGSFKLKSYSAEARLLYGQNRVALMEWELFKIPNTINSYNIFIRYFDVRRIREQVGLQKLFLCNSIKIIREKYPAYDIRNLSTFPNGINDNALHQLGFRENANNRIGIAVVDINDFIAICERNNLIRNDLIRLR